jgi:hypothetical protein
MDVETAITTLVTHLSDRLAVPVRVSGMQDERPVPLVLIEDFDLTDHTYHNSAYAGQAEDPNDGEEKLYYRFYYDLRLEIVVKDSDEVGATSLLDSLRGAIRMLRENPQSFHPHLNEMQLRGADGFDHQFIEPTETELNQTIVLKAFTEAKEPLAGYDTIEDIVNQITLT